jgi:16S rRNA (uracil1498-N3)-methyltransferase
MSERFFLTTAPQGGTAVLDGDEARHLARVLRAKVGDTVTLFDGRGSAWQATVANLGRDRVTLDLGPTLPTTPRPAVPVTLAVALPKGDRQKWMVEKLTELGVSRLVPLITTRGVAEATDSARSRLERGVIEACKQCGRDTLMEIGAASSISDLLATVPSHTRTLLADPHGRPPEAVLAAGPTAAILVLVGPEGGFTAEEVSAAEAAGCDRVTFGRHILRIETAAIAAAARLA